jgi:type IV secretory pathway VirB4 component
MNEEEKKAIEKFIEKCNKYDESVEIKGVSVGEEYRILTTVCKALNHIEKLQKENEDITQQRDYYKARYNEFNEAFIENGRKLTK